MDRPIVLTPRDRDILRAAVDHLRKTVRSPRNRPVPHEPTRFTPDVCIATTPSGGIPALSSGSNVGTSVVAHLDDVPGKGVCQLYRMVGRPGASVTLAKIPRTVTVYNFLPVAIPGGQWITPMRDKFGYWLIPAQGLLFGNC